MKDIRLKWQFIFILLIFFSCNGNRNTKRYFDIPAYFTSEIDSAKNNFQAVDKRAVYNGDTSISVVKVSGMNWKKEWAIFLEANINKPIYYANMTESDLGQYRAQSNKLSIQKVDLEYAKNADGVPISDVIGVDISISKGNLISTTEIQANYNRYIGYNIKGVQKINYLNQSNTFSIEGRFK